MDDWAAIHEGNISAVKTRPGGQANDNMTGSKHIDIGNNIIFKYIATYFNSLYTDTVCCCGICETGPASSITCHSMKLLNNLKMTNYYKIQEITWRKR